MSTKQKTYSNEFKEEAVKRVMNGIPASQVARLDINVNSLYTWKQRYMKHPEQPFVGLVNLIHGKGLAERIA